MKMSKARLAASPANSPSPLPSQAQVPSIGALNKRFDAFEAKGKSNDDDDDDDDRECDKLFFSGQDVIKTIVAVFAPMITGSIESLSSILGKA